MNEKHTLAASFLSYVCSAAICGFPPLLFLIFHREFDIPLSVITWLITVNFVVQITVDLLSALFVDRIGYRVCVITALLFVSVGLASLGILPDVFDVPFVGLLVADVLYAIGGGLLEVLVSPIVEACPTKNKSSVMSLLHSFFCWGSLFVILASTAFFAVFGYENWRTMALIWAAFPLLDAVFFAFVPLWKISDENVPSSGPSPLKSKTFWLLLLLMFAGGAAEQGMSQWASAFVESSLGLTKSLGDVVGPCLFFAVMGFARVLYAKMSEKVNLSAYMGACSLLCLVSYLLASLSPWVPLSLIGCILCGFSVGVMWPGLISLSSSRFPKCGTALFAWLAFAGDIGCAGGPSLVGFLSDAFGGSLQKALLVGTAFPVILLVGFIILRQSKRV